MKDDIYWILYRLRALALLALCLIWGAQSAVADMTVTPEQAYQELMQLGHTALSEDAPQKAALYFSKALRVAPTNPTPQLAMAEAWVRQGQIRKTEAFLQHLLRDPDQARNADHYLKAFSQLQKRYPLVASASFAVLPSTNIRNTSSETVFDTLLGRFNIDDGGQETSGIGSEASARLSYRRPLAKGLSFELGTTLKRVWYSDPDLRFWRGRVSADVRTFDTTGELRAGLHVDRTYYGETEGTSSDRTITGAHLSWSHALSSDTRLNLSALAEYRDYLDKGSLSGPYGALSIGWRKRLEKGAILSFGGTLERSTPKLNYHRYWGAGLRTGYDMRLTDTFRVGVDLSANLRLYDTDFAAVNYARRDEIYRVGLSLSDSRLKLMGVTPKLSCGYRVQSSNIALYSSNTTDCRIGWSYNF